MKILPLLPLLAALPMGQALAAEAPKSRPNIVIILADDLGYSDFGCYGGEIRTPNIDKLAQRGVRFSSYYSEAKCNPSRQQILTGKYASRAYLGRDATLAETLVGYESYAVGKWDMLVEIGEQRLRPQIRGFSHFFGTPMGCGSYFAPLKLTRDGKPAEQESMAPGFYYTDAITDNAIRYIEGTPADKPLFLYTAYTAPHWPLHAREEDIAHYKGHYQDGPVRLREARLARMKAMGLIAENVALPPMESQPREGEWQQRRMEVYAAQVECVDRGVGRILETLEKTGRRENTLILVTSDNGPSAEEYASNRGGVYLNATTRDGRKLRVGNTPEVMPGAEDTWQSYGPQWASLSNTPLRRYKGEEFEGGIRVPLIVCGPGVTVKPGSIVRNVAHEIDLLPTILEAAALPYPQTFENRQVQPPDGKSLLPLLKGETQAPREALFWEFSNKRAIRTGDMKAVYSTGGTWEMYDIAADPTESHNLAAAFPKELESMSAMWETWFEPFASRLMENPKADGESDAHKQAKYRNTRKVK